MFNMRTEIKTISSDVGGGGGDRAGRFIIKFVYHSFLSSPNRNISELQISVLYFSSEIGVKKHESALPHSYQ